MIKIDNKKHYINRAFNKNSVSVVFESSGYFIPFLDVALKSLCNECSPDTNYDIIILGSNIDKYDERILREQYNSLNNISLRFFDPNSLVKKYMEDAKYDYLDLNYFRMALPWILPKYEKVVQLGADIVIKRDIEKLYNTNFNDEKYLAGVRDLGYLGRLKMDIPKEELGMVHYLDYVNADVLVYNLKGIRENYSIEEVMQVWQKYKMRCSEQDALNLIFDGKIELLDSRWNVFPRKMVSEMHISNAPIEFQKQRIKDLSNPYIVHFAAIPKPWEYPMVEVGNSWWNYARQSVYYEEILRRLMIWTIKVEGSSIPKSIPRKIADGILPLGSRRRKLIKKIIPKGSVLWRIGKRIWNFILSTMKGKPIDEKYGRLGEGCK